MSKGNSQITYNVKILPKSHELEIVMHLCGPVARGTIQLATPSWVPGSYTFECYGRDLFDLNAIETEGKKTLKVHRDGWEGYRIENGNGNVTLSYKAYAYSLDFSESMGIVDNDYAVLLGARYLYPRKYFGPLKVIYSDLPKEWQIHHPSGAKCIENTTGWIYPSYEILLDTPVTFGKFQMLQRNVQGTKFFFVFVDTCVGYETEVNRFVDKLACSAEQFYQMFGAFPFEDYTFVMSFDPELDWGLEHLTSSMCGLGPYVFVDESAFAEGVRVCIHELFHAWNVRRLRPTPLGDLAHHLSDGSFTEGLWLAEGFTRYYEFLIGTRVGAYSTDQFFSSVIGYYRALTAQPAYNRVSATDSSLATFLNHNKYSGRTNNSIDYYDKGMLIAFDTDSTLLCNDSSLDQAFKEFYAKFFHGIHGKGYSTTDVVNFFNDVIPNLGDTMAKAIEHPGGLQTLQMLKSLGFEVIMNDVYYLGLLFSENISPNIYNVLDNSPAAQSGIAPSDIISQVNGFNFSDKTLKWAATHSYEITLNVLRGHRNLTFKITPKIRKEVGELIWKGTEKQAQLIGKWLHKKDFNPKNNQKFDLSFYANFHGVEILI